MRRNMLSVLAIAGLMGPMSVSSPMVVVLDDDIDDVARLKRLEARRYEGLESRVSDAQISEKLGRAQPRRNVPAGINRRIGEPHQHSREIARRLRQKASHA